MRRLETLSDVVYGIAIWRVFMLFPRPDEPAWNWHSWREFFAAEGLTVVLIAIAVTVLIIYWLQSNTLFSLVERADGKFAVRAIMQLFFVLLFLFSIRVGTELPASAWTRGFESVAALLLGTSWGQACLALAVALVASGCANLGLDVDNDSTNDFANIGETEFRRGRLSVGNAHGSELRDLAVPVAMQFFDASIGGFRVNPDDNCTPITSVDLSDVDAADSLAVADSCIVDPAAASGIFACAPGTPGDQYTAVAAAGRYVTSLRAPGAARTGALRIRAVALSWAQFDWFSAGNTNPIGLGTFGIYNRETELIYQREIR